MAVGSAHRALTSHDDDDLRQLRGDVHALLELAAGVSDAPHAAVVLVDGRQLCREDSPPVPVTVVPLQGARGTPLDAEASAPDAFHVSIPLHGPHREPLGQLVVFDDAPRRLERRQWELLTLVADQTERVIGNRSALRRSEARGERLSDERDRLDLFSAQVAHDLRSPLTVMIGQAELAADHPGVTSDEGLTTILARVESAGHRMRRMIESALDHARLGHDMAFGRVDLDVVLASAVEDVADRVARTSAVVEVGPMPTVTGDEAMLHTVVVNLLSNSLAYQRPDVPPRISVLAGRRGRHWRVTVSDNGIGIAPAAAARIFDLFGRAHTDDEGHGVGLTGARRIIEAHGGRMGVDTTSAATAVGADGAAPTASYGASVWFELPIAA